MPKIKTGLEVLLEKRALTGVRVGFLCHQASVDSHLRHGIDLLEEANLNLTAIFGPEHGLWGTAQDQIEVPSQARDRIPVYSLYADHRFPTEVMLKDIDVLVCDLQDVGSRYYTFVWTMALAMQACAKYHKKFMVLDRPNPLGGAVLEGPVLDPDYASFVGLYPVPVRHGMTIGELALWINEGLGVQAELEVVPMKGWKRSMYFDSTGLPWVLPSPNMPTLETALVYPGMCLVEGTNLSEGRGTTRPFEIIGAPFIQPDVLEKSVRKHKLPGLLTRACRFEPTFHKFQGLPCGGIQLHVTDRKKFKPFLTGLTLIQTIQELYPQNFAWRNPPYEYETQKLPFDILCGTASIRTSLDTRKPIRTLESHWVDDLQKFARQRQPFLLYN